MAHDPIVHSPASGLPAERALVALILAAFPLDGIRPAAPSLNEGEWAEVASTAAGHGLKPLLNTAAKSLGAQVSPPPAVMADLRAAYFRTEAANLAVHQELGALLSAFAHEGIAVVVLKGAALAVTLYADMGVRPMVDVDLLVRQEDFARGGSVLRAARYERLRQPLAGTGAEFDGAEELRRPGGVRSVDLHWHPFASSYSRARFPVEWFWQYSVAAPALGPTARVLSAEAQLLHLCAHFAKHTAGRLFRSYDIALLIARHHDTLAWDAVMEAAGAYRVMPALCQTLLNVCDVWHLSLPADVLARLKAFRPQPLQAALFAIIYAPPTNIALLLNGFYQPGLRKKLAYWLGPAFPSAAYMRQRYHIPHPALLPLFYLRRLAGGAYQAL
ncbi:MAG: nucleotidyltransferase family protein, partial [Chloroflexi bacterium]|nr:nucleotidyltransferase family protein [Chloroflexota bacterium]